MGSYAFSSVGELVTEKIADYLPLIKPLDNDANRQYIDLWLKLIKENSSLRAIKDKKVISVREDYYDEMILSYTRRSLARCARIVGETFGGAERYISDDFIFWRVLEFN